MNIKLLSLLNGTWAIHKSFALSHFSSIAEIIQGVEFEEGEEPKETIPFASYGNETHSVYDDAPKGSIAVITLAGPMTKNDQFCGPVGTSTLAQRISEADNHENIGAILFRVDSGGGHTNSIPVLEDAFLASKKPIIAFVDDTMASAALMSTARANLIIAAHNKAQIGSLGVMAAFADHKPVAVAEGIVFHDVYADQSDLKNKVMTDALKGDYKLLKKEVLNPLAEQAISDYKAARTVSNDDFFKGKMFFADEALEIGAIDEIGNFDYAIKRASELANQHQAKNKKTNLISNNNSSKTSNKKNPFNMKRNQIPAIAYVLGFDSMEAVDGKYSISKADVAKLQSNHFSKFGVALPFTEATFEKDGSVSITADGLVQMNLDITNAMIEANSKVDGKLKETYEAKMKALQDEHAAKIKAANDKIALLSDEPEDNDPPTIKPDGQTATFVAPTSGLNVADELHPWNAAAVAVANGNKSYAHFVVAQGMTKAAINQLQQELITSGESTLDISQMNDLLGGFHRENTQEVRDMLVANEEINSIFPLRSTGIKDELVGLSLYAEDFLQARNEDWAEKGGFEIQADIIKLKNWQVSHRFTAAQMWQFVESWLATKTSGTDPFQDSLVNWLTTKMLFQIAMSERPVNAIRGVYLKPAKGIAGKSINSQDGILINLKKLIKDKRIKTFKTGAPSYNHLDDAGDPNKNHIYYKINNTIKLIPQALRDSGVWEVLVSKNDVRERETFISQIVATDANYIKQEKAESYSNFKITGVPHWPDGLIVITLPRNILQGYRDKADDNRLTFDKEKRDTIAFMDGASVIAPVLSGFKYKTLEELNAADGIRQRVFTNGEFGAFTPIELAADEATPSIAVHNVLRTVENTAATTITDIKDAEIGDVIYIIGGHDTNASKILKANAKFVGLAADITFTTGVVAKFLMTAADKYTLIALYQEASQGAIQFEADDVTPDVSEGQLFITSSENTGATAITNFIGAQVGVPFTVLGGGGTASTIAKAGKFAYISAAWTGDAGESITLMKRPDGLFVEVLA